MKKTKDKKNKKENEEENMKREKREGWRLEVAWRSWIGSSFIAAHRFRSVHSALRACL